MTVHTSLDELTSMEPSIESPCIGICTLNEENICLGCGRGVSEIQAWQSNSVDEKLNILQQAHERVTALEALSPGLAEARKHKIETLRQDARNHKFKR